MSFPCNDPEYNVILTNVQTAVKIDSKSKEMETSKWS